MTDIVTQLRNLEQEYANLAIYNWITSAFLSWNWWILLLFVIAPWIIFLKILNRKKAKEIWLFGLFCMLITTFVDDLGSELGIWNYPIKFVPVGLVAMPFDLSVIPVVFMLIYQYFETWKQYIIAVVCSSLVLAFIAEPICVFLELVHYFEWKYRYSFIFYILTGIAARAFTRKWAYTHHPS